MRLKDTITPEMKLGRPEFENTVFMLNNPVNALNLDHFAFQGNLVPEPIDEVDGKNRQRQKWGLRLGQSGSAGFYPRNAIAPGKHGSQSH